MKNYYIILIINYLLLIDDQQPFNESLRLVSSRIAICCDHGTLKKKKNLITSFLSQLQEEKKHSMKFFPFDLQIEICE